MGAYYAHPRLKEPDGLYSHNGESQALQRVIH
jgi:hypothetical protein